MALGIVLSHFSGSITATSQPLQATCDQGDPTRAGFTAAVDSLVDVRAGVSTPLSYNVGGPSATAVYIALSEELIDQDGVPVRVGQRHGCRALVSGVGINGDIHPDPDSLQPLLNLPHIEITV